MSFLSALFGLDYTRGSVRLDQAAMLARLPAITPHHEHLAPPEADRAAGLLLSRVVWERFADNYWHADDLGDYEGVCPGFPVCHNYADCSNADFQRGAARARILLPWYFEAKVTLTQGRHALLFVPLADGTARWFQGQTGVWVDDLPGLMSVDEEEA